MKMPPLEIAISNGWTQIGANRTENNLAMFSQKTPYLPRRSAKETWLKHKLIIIHKKHFFVHSDSIRFPTVKNCVVSKWKMCTFFYWTIIVSFISDFLHAKCSVPLHSYIGFGLFLLAVEFLYYILYTLSQSRILEGRAFYLRDFESFLKNQISSVLTYIIYTPKPSSK